MPEIIDNECMIVYTRQNNKKITVSKQIIFVHQKYVSKFNNRYGERSFTIAMVKEVST